MPRFTAHALAATLCMTLAMPAAPQGRAQEAPQPRRAILLKQESPMTGRDIVMASIVLPPGAAEGWHSHPAELYGFVEEGVVVLQIRGKPDRTLKAGEVFFVAPGEIHQAVNRERATARGSALFIAEKGEPLVTPAQP